MTSLTAHRGEILHCLNENEHQYFEDGVLLIKDGYIENVGSAVDLINNLPVGTELIEHPNCLITPGFVDTHIHYPQCEIIASYGEQLLEWLETYTFPAEQKFADKEYASRIARFFLDQLIKNGTTTAMVFATVHPQSVDAFFTEAEKHNLRMICGKVMMDRNAPQALLDTPESSYQESRDLIEKWHNKGRLAYAVTPRFAPTSSDEQLASAGRLLKEYPDVHFQTHLSENKKECEWVAELFPESKNYLDVYDRHQLLGKRSLFAHGIYLDDGEWQRLAETDSAISFCPGSNLFIGSGLFKLHKAREHQVKTGLGTDVAGGDSFSLLRTINQAYKTQQLQGEKLSALDSFYLATLGGARALDLHDKIGNFETGKEADFVILDYQATDLLGFKMQYCESLEERLFTLLLLGDDRAVKQTYIMGAEITF